MINSFVICLLFQHFTSLQIFIDDDNCLICCLECSLMGLEFLGETFGLRVAVCFGFKWIIVDEHVKREEGKLSASCPCIIHHLLSMCCATTSSWTRQPKIIMVRYTSKFPVSRFIYKAHTPTPLDFLFRLMLLCFVVFSVARSKKKQQKMIVTQIEPLCVQYHLCNFVYKTSSRGK